MSRLPHVDGDHVQLGDILPISQPSSTELASTIAKNLRNARSRLGLTQEQIAERCGITTEFYGRMERGKSLPSVLTLIRIAHGMEIMPGCLLEDVAVSAKVTRVDTR